MTVATKRMVLTGATRGLGRALLPHFIQAGFAIAGCGRSAAAVAALADQYGSPHEFAAIDVSDFDAVQTWANRVLARSGPPDFLINNAAVIHTPAPLWKIPAEEFNRVIDINIKGVANILRAFLPAMVDRKQGVIVNLSSGWGRSTSPEVAGYCASKYAVEGLTLALAQELPAGMAAIPLNPGVIDTDMLRQCFGEAAASYPNADTWAVRAAPYILQLGVKDNGRSLSVG